jgi:hypothetical protein
MTPMQCPWTYPRRSSPVERSPTSSNMGPREGGHGTIVMERSDGMARGFQWVLFLLLMDPGSTVVLSNHLPSSIGWIHE